MRFAFAIQPQNLQVVVIAHADVYKVAKRDATRHGDGGQRIAVLSIFWQTYGERGAVSLVRFHRDGAAMRQRRLTGYV
jgi:hypothetical protein